MFFRKKKYDGPSGIQGEDPSPKTQLEWHTKRIAELEEQLQALYRHLGVYPHRDNSVQLKKLDNANSSGSSVMAKKA